IVKRASSPVVRWAARAGTPAPHFLPVEDHGSWSRLHNDTALLIAVLVTDRHCKTGVLARCPLGCAGGDARATFFASRRSWFLEPASQRHGPANSCSRDRPPL